MEARNIDYTPLNAMSRISWGSIFAGVFVAMFFQLLLGLLGLAIGLTVINIGQAVGEGDAPVKGISIAAGIWTLLSTLISVFIGAFVAGRLAGLSAKYDGLLHGVVTLAFLAILSLFLISSGVTSAIGGAFSFGLQAAQTPQAQQAMPSMSQIQQQVSGQAQQAQQNITPQQRQQMARQAEKVATQAAWWTFIAALLALIAAMAGGYLGMQSRVRQIIHEEM